METQMKNVEYLGRGIHNKKFIESLMNGKLRQMLIAISNDKDLDVQIRNDNFNIYYKGGNLARVRSENCIEFEMLYYNEEEISTMEIKLNPVKRKDLKSQRDLMIGKFKAGNYEDYFIHAKEVMDKWFYKNPNPERLEQHLLSIENQYNKSDYTIIDLEYKVSTLSDFACLYIPKGKDKPKNPIFDIIAINKQGKLFIIELKKGIGALGNTSGLKEHWDCYQHSIGRNYQLFMIEMKNLLKQKQVFNLIDKQVEIKNPIPEFLFAYAYDDKNSIEQQDIAFRREYKKVGAIIPILTLACGTRKLLDK